MDEGSKLIVVFDEECLLCSRLVRYILKKDEQRTVYFTSSRSHFFSTAYPSIQNLAANYLIVIANNRLFYRSDAVIEICKQVKNLQFYGKGISLFHKKIRDAVYIWIAKNRYRIFGKSTICFLPKEEEKEQFIN